MTVTFNALEIFEIAGQIERNGAHFYRSAAAIFDAPPIREMLLRLAEWETEHEQTFAHMKEQLSRPHADLRSFRPGQTLPDPRVMAGLAVFGIRAEPTEELNGKECRADILRRAVEKEKDSIVFYHGLKDFLCGATDQEQIDNIIREEMRHISILDESFKQTE